MSTHYIVEPLVLEKHRVAEFFCEEHELTEFLQHRAMAEMTARASACFVLVPKSDPGRIAGFYTLSAATISLGKLPAEMASRLPLYPNLPATLQVPLDVYDVSGGWRGASDQINPVVILPVKSDLKYAMAMIETR